MTSYIGSYFNRNSVKGGNTTSSHAIVNTAVCLIEYYRVKAVEDITSKIKHYKLGTQDLLNAKDI